LYGPGDYSPNIPVSYWSFRLMIGLGVVALVVGLVGLWLTRRGRLGEGKLGKWLWRLGPFAIALPLLANSFGWIFTEMGRQPWVVFGLMKTSAGVSPNVSAGTVLTSLIVFTALYGVLAVVEVLLTVRFAKAGPPPPAAEAAASAEESGEAERPLTFAY
jgi:cytochrome d ubiquinol oxidase subunit I